MIALLSFPFVPLVCEIFRSNIRRESRFGLRKQYCILPGRVVEYLKLSTRVERFLSGGERYMPNIKSAIKRVKTSEKRRLRNASQKSALRTAIKSFETAAAGANPETAREALIQASRKLDKAASKGLIHKNAAARKKSRLAKKLNEISANA